MSLPCIRAYGPEFTVRLCGDDEGDVVVHDAAPDGEPPLVIGDVSQPLVSGDVVSVTILQAKGRKQMVQ